jgi:NAD(P)-dependent dehydrogenase (short-subunit alcohol dehydrogenase family)
LSARTVVVTGGTRGIGLAIARGFAAAGDTVFVGARQPMTGEPGSLTFVATDVRKRADLVALAERAAGATGRVDVFVNAAGVSAWRPLDAVDEAFWDRLLETNAKGTFFGCQAAAARLTSGGSIINISSIAGKRGSANNAVYCASKFAVNGVTQALAKELGPRGIRVNAVCPVYIMTPGLHEALQDPHAPPAGGPVDAYLRSFTDAQSALGRLPAAEDVAAVCVFLASPAAAAITGQCINVDCGVLPQ